MLVKISMYCRNFTVLSSFIDVKKQRPTMNLEKCYQCCANIEISLDLKVYFSLKTCKINNLIALLSTNQITEISAPWWIWSLVEKLTITLLMSKTLLNFYHAFLHKYISNKLYYSFKKSQFYWIPLPMNNLL